MKIIRYIGAVLLAAFAGQGCSLLDTTPDGRETLDQIFADHDKTAAYLNTCYMNLPTKGTSYYWGLQRPDGAVGRGVSGFGNDQRRHSRQDVHERRYGLFASAARLQWPYGELLQHLHAATPLLHDFPAVYRQGGCQFRKRACPLARRSAYAARLLYAGDAQMVRSFRHTSRTAIPTVTTIRR